MSLALGAYLVFVLGTWGAHGFYTPRSLAATLLGLACAFVAARKVAIPAPGARALGGALALFLLLGVWRDPTRTLELAVYHLGYRTLCLLLLGLAVRWLMTGKGMRALVGLGLAGALVFRLLMPVVYPDVSIDVFSLSQAAARLLAQGHNPYVQTLPDNSAHYVYPPATLYLQTLGWLPTGDVRYASVAADAVFALCLFLLARRRWPGPEPAMLALLALYQPYGIFVLEQAWTEPLMGAALAVAMLLRDRGRLTASAAAFGFFMALKQYTLFFALHWLIIERNWRRILLAVGVALLTALPFALWDWDSFLSKAVLFTYQGIPFRSDTHSFGAVIAPLWGPPAKGATVIFGAIVALGTYLRFRRDGLPGFGWAATLTTYAMFALGTQSYINYYYFVNAVWLLTLVQGADDTARHPPR